MATVTARMQQATPAIERMAGTVFDEKTLSAFVHTALMACRRGDPKITQSQYNALYQSIEHLMGSVQDVSIIRNNMHRVIANWHFIAEGMRIPEWQGERIDADVVFIGLDKPKVGDHVALCHLTAKLKAGIAAGIIIRTRLHRTYVQGFLDRVAGVSSYECPVEEIAGMEARLTLYMSGGEVRIKDWNCTADQKKHNRQLSEARGDVSKCQNPVPCNTCPKNIRQCNLAVWTEEKENQ